MIDLQKRVAACTMQDGGTATNSECLVAGTEVSIPETEPWRTQLFCTEVEAGYWLDPDQPTATNLQPVLGQPQMAWKPMSPAAGFVHKCIEQPFCGHSADFCVGQIKSAALESQFSYGVGALFLILFWT